MTRETAMTNDNLGQRVPLTYAFASDEELERVCNGCGPGEGWKNVIVPDTIYGISITEACDVHDWMYEMGGDIRDREFADQVFLDNILHLITLRSRTTIWGLMTFWANPLRVLRARKYFTAVSLLGNHHFNWNA